MVTEVNDRTGLHIWWERQNQLLKQAAVKSYPLPSDGAAWVVMVNFFAVVGLGNAKIEVKRLNAEPIVDSFLDLWPKRVTWCKNDTIH